MARMVDIDDFLPQVLLYAPNCPDQVAYRFLREAAREFCQRTKCWRESDEMTISAPECEGVGTTGDSEIHLIQRAELNGSLLEPRPVEWLDEHKPGWETSTDIAQARYITQLQPNTVTVFPRAEGVLTMRLVLKPSLSALTLPSFLLEQWGTEIGKGAAARVLLLPESQNPDLGTGLLQEFRECLGTEATRVAKGQQGARLRTKGRYF